MTVKLITELPTLPQREVTAHKGDFGRVLLIGGSRGMAGAIALSGLACLRSGAGLVRLAVPVEVQPQVASFNPCYMTLPLPQDANGRVTIEACDSVTESLMWANVIAIGPGLGRGHGVTEYVKHVITRASGQLIIDADGLFALASIPKEYWPRREQPMILTPHTGEFARLTGKTVKEIEQNRELLAVEYAREMNVVLLLKGHRTIVTDGARLYTNTTGNPGMATGGSGDVLTGVIAALTGQGLDAFSAAILGSHLHGVAGDLAAEKFGQISMIASDIVDHLSPAFRRFQQRFIDSSLV